MGIKLKHLPEREIEEILRFTTALGVLLQGQENHVEKLAEIGNKFLEEVIAHPRPLTMEETVIATYLNELSLCAQAYMRLRDKILMALRQSLTQEEVHQSVQDLLAKIRSEI